ncbi:tRNA pseudouridine38-40 synthase [Marinospirillum celere]|uniref:tRNA pseudouridine synthase A n=1 Tax=Marinospirillum celere TaxID=1122252 RepID=A0A1I1JHE5_9GAMM|nr:tRNA pseudouridine(38-40) synthase TruA [Marinospirillum celere]SFC44870.1 tRNA pseudouridine38-40 synthase [Marinospirillum celere]
MALLDPFAVFDETHAQAGRIALGVEYEGSQFRGWQTQSEGIPSLQPLLEKALSRLAKEPISVMCAGRTDAGVHASGMVVHFDTQAALPERAWTLGINSSLPPALRVRWARPVPANFHARHSAIARRYRYIIYNHRTRPSILDGQLTWWNQPLNAERMHEAAQLLIGEKDFSAFRSIRCQSRIAWRHMHFIKVLRRGELLIIDIQANAFLHHMVRNIVGTLIKIGRHEKPIEWINELLASKERAQAGITAPAAGLYFVAALYPEHFGLPCERLGPNFISLLADEELDAPYPEFLPEWHRTDLTRSQSRVHSSQDISTDV